MGTVLLILLKSLIELCSAVNVGSQHKVSMTVSITFFLVAYFKQQKSTDRVIVPYFAVALSFANTGFITQ